MRHTDRRLRLSKWLVFLILCFIWGNSLLPAELSRSFSMWVGSLLGPVLPGSLEVLPEQGHGLLRKFAHFSEFAALGAALSWQFGMLKKKKTKALGYGFGAACVDEFIQLFVPERGPSLTDVAIDTCGFAAGMLLLVFGQYLLRKPKQSKENKTL